MSGETFTLYVKSTSNYTPGSPLETFERLGAEWSGDSIMIPFGPEGEDDLLAVVGWSDLNYGEPCPVHVSAVRWTPARGRELDGDPLIGPLTGYLVWGGNAGVRILDPDAAPQAGVDDWLPLGWGWPFVWITDPADLPPKVLAVVGYLDLDPPDRRRGQVFTIKELAERVAGGNEFAMRALLNSAVLNYEMPRPLLDEHQANPHETVTRDVVIALAALRAGDRVGFHCAALLGETRTTRKEVRSDEL